jgi:hypothetical protein
MDRDGDTGLHGTADRDDDGWDRLDGFDVFDGDATPPSAASTASRRARAMRSALGHEAGPWP